MGVIRRYKAFSSVKTLGQKNCGAAPYPLLDSTEEARWRKRSVPHICVCDLGSAFDQGADDVVFHHQ